MDVDAVLAGPAIAQLPPVPTLPLASDRPERQAGEGKNFDDGDCCPARPVPPYHHYNHSRKKKIFAFFIFIKKKKKNNALIFLVFLVKIEFCFLKK